MAYIMTANEMIEKCLDIVNNYKTIYMYATYGFQVNDETIAGKAKQNLNGWYTTKRINTLKAVANQTPPTWGFDCVNLLKGILWGWCGDASKKTGGSKYGSNGVPDTNANGFFKRCTQKSSDFSTIQRGEAVWLDGHIGIYIGDNLCIECTPKFSNGVLISGLENVAKSTEYPNRTWTQHGFIPWLDYENAQSTETPPKKYEFGERTLQRGLPKSDDIQELQEYLIELGFDLGSYGADGDFGSKTEKAVQDFQKKYGLTVTGVFDKTAYDKLMEITKDKGGETEEPEVEQTPEVTPKVEMDYKVTGGSVWLWDRHPSYGGEKMLVVHRNDEFEAPDLGNYIPIIYNNSIKWISKKYIKEI